MCFPAGLTQAAFLLKVLQARAGAAGQAVEVRTTTAAGGAATGGAGETAKEEEEVAQGSGGAESVTAAAPSVPISGAAAGPRWLASLSAQLAQPSSHPPPVHPRTRTRTLRVELGCEVLDVVGTPEDAPGITHGDTTSTAAGGGAAEGRPWPIEVVLSSGERVGADVAVVAAGVEPNTAWLRGSTVALAADGGVLVDARMQSVTCPCVFAAGDAATAGWAKAEDPSGGPHWFQMRLWSQARAAGVAAARAMIGQSDDEVSGFSFELFSHVTEFFGLKVVLLGRYNGQGLEHEPAADMISYVREVPPADPLPSPSSSSAKDQSATAALAGCSFARVLLLRGRLVGAVLIGEAASELGETFENLILDGLDLSAFGSGLLDPAAELDDFFD